LSYFEWQALRLKRVTGPRWFHINTCSMSPVRRLISGNRAGSAFTRVVPSLFAELSNPFRFQPTRRPRAVLQCCSRSRPNARWIFPDEKSTRRVELRGSNREAALAGVVAIPALKIGTWCTQKPYEKSWSLHRKEGRRARDAWNPDLTACYPHGSGRFECRPCLQAEH
jgi:hypothetical protein